MRKVVVGIVSLFMVITMAPVYTAAQTETEAVEETTTSTEDDTTQTDRAAEREARIQANKDRVTERLSAAEERRISAACTAAQARVAQAQTNLDTVIENRTQVYATIADKFSDLIPKLQEAGIDTAELEAATSLISSQYIPAITTAVRTYQTTLSDLASMDCEADPSGFKATLTEARTQRAAAVQASQDMRDYIENTIKPQLSAIRAELAG